VKCLRLSSTSNVFLHTSWQSPLCT
jgi:hypothetical protein